MTRENEAHRLLHAWSLQPYHRLRSIAADVDFVAEVAAQVGGVDAPVPLLANLRCGVWYVPPERRAATTHFKSGDGHYGQWSFSPRRANLHLLRLLATHGRAVVVDATRSGKRFPDALSKTLPIWVCVVNRALLLREDDDDDSGDVDGSSGDRDQLAPLVLPPWVSPQEAHSIELLLPTWVRHLRRVTKGMAEFRRSRPTRPLGVLWIHRTSSVLEDYSHLPFVPIFALSASRELQEGERADVDGYHYVPGAGDDEETWARGLTPDQFHQFRRELLDGGAERCEERIRAIVAHTGVVGRHLSPTVLLGGGGGGGAVDVPQRIWDTGVSLAMETGCLSDPLRWQPFEVVAVLGDGERGLVSSTREDGLGEKLFTWPLTNRKGRYDARYGLQRSLQEVLAVLQRHPTVLLTSPRGCDAALVALLAFLTTCCVHDEESGGYRRRTWRDEEEIRSALQKGAVVTKAKVNEALLRMAVLYPYPLSPSRASLKQLHRALVAKEEDPS